MRLHFSFKIDLRRMNAKFVCPRQTFTSCSLKTDSKRLETLLNKCEKPLVSPLALYASLLGILMECDNHLLPSNSKEIATFVPYL